MLERWEHQRFLGRPATYGDDRSLTNFVLRNWNVRYDELARSRTIVPAHFRVFLRQQLRWKRSWTRESLIVGALHLAQAARSRASGRTSGSSCRWSRRSWRCARSPGSRWSAGAGAPFVYLIGIYAMALVYGLYYGLKHGRYDTLWVFGVMFVFFYLAFLLWQTYYAILTSRNSSWGTRAAAAGGGAMTLVGSAMRGAVAFLLLPLSLVPLYFAVPKIRSEVAQAGARPRAVRRAEARAQRRAAGALAAAAP